MEPITSQANHDTYMRLSKPNVDYVQGSDRQEIKNNIKSITRIINTFLDEERKGSQISEDTKHLCQRTIPDTDNTKFYSEQKLRTKPEITHHPSNQEPCYIGFQQIQQERDNISRNTCDPNSIQPEYLYDKTTTWSSKRSSDTRSSSCVSIRLKCPYHHNPQRQNFT
ncbi:hypothetical protein COBT_000892 [Conglomerata obtusa]